MKNMASSFDEKIKKNTGHNTGSIKFENVIDWPRLC